MYDVASRLKMARLKAGMSLQDLANKSNAVTKQAISKYEKSLMKPTMETLVQLSSVLNVSVDYFLKENTINLDGIKYRKQSRLTVKMKNIINEKTRDFLERYIEAENILGDFSEFDKKENFYRIELEEDVERVAIEVRHKWGLGTRPIYNILELLEEKGVRVLYIDQEIDHFSGLSTWVNDSIPVIVLSKMFIDRLRFTALHELAHLILDIHHFDDNEQERICNRFAGAMLIPKDELLNELGGIRKKVDFQELCLIKAEFGISPQALLYRSRQLGYIPERYFTSQTKFYRMRGMWHKELGTYKGEEKTNRLNQLIYRGIAEEYITSAKAANLLGMTLSQLRDERKNFYEENTH